MIRALSPLLVAASLLCASPASAKGPPSSTSFDYDKQIKRKQRELKRVLQQQKQAQKAIKKDRAAFEGYKARTKKRADTLRSQTNTITASVAEWRAKYAKLGGVIGRHKRSARGFAFRQQNFKKRLIKHCDALLALARTLPPLLSKKTVAELDYLKSELKGGSADNVEGLHRLVRVARRIDAQLMDIQVVQGSSPIPQITGTCHRLRIGGVFEAVAKGETAAIWDFETNTWVRVKDPKRARMLSEAIEVRNGKKMPRLVQIPIAPAASAARSAPPQAETDGGAAADAGAAKASTKAKKPARKIRRPGRRRAKKPASKTKPASRTKPASKAGQP